jgi:3-hydroxymyristoyl/3-hydroxydecanoyl-(acyl carrier protein) dehydratase
MFLHMVIERSRQDVWRFNGKAMVNDNIVCTADITLVGKKIDD